MLAERALLLVCVRAMFSSSCHLLALYLCVHECERQLNEYHPPPVYSFTRPPLLALTRYTVMVGCVQAQLNPDRALVLDDGMCNQLVVACAAEGLLDEAIKMYRQMRIEVNTRTEATLSQSPSLSSFVITSACVGSCWIGI